MPYFTLQSPAGIFVLRWHRNRLILNSAKLTSVKHARGNLRTMTAFDLIIILVLSVGGIGLFASSLKTFDWLGMGCSACHDAPHTAWPSFALVIKSEAAVLDEFPLSYPPHDLPHAFVGNNHLSRTPDTAASLDIGRKENNQSPLVAVTDHLDCTFAKMPQY